MPAQIQTRLPVIGVFVAGAASALGFAPLGWWPLTLVCLALLIQLVRTAATLRSAFSRGYVFGLGHFIVGLNWIAGSFRYQDSMPVWLGWIAVVALALYVAVYPALAAALAWRWGRDKPATFILLFAAAWIVTEWLRATMFTGFAWNPLGVVWVGWNVSQVAVLTGTYGLSGVTLLIVGVLMNYAKEPIRWLAKHAKRYPETLRAMLADGTWPTGLMLPLIVPAGVLVFIAMPLNLIVHTSRTETGSGPLIRIVQPNIGQQDKHNPAFARTNFAKLASLSGKPGREPRLLLWPEAAIPEYLDETEIEAVMARARITGLLGPRDILLTGGVKRHFKRTNHPGYYEEELVGARNSVFGMDAVATLLFRYDKAHLVPYGEYLPMKPVLSVIGLTRLVPGTVDFWPGPGARSFAVPGFGKAGVQICYEIIFSGAVVDRMNRPDFLFNPSNDAWFGSWGPPQHLAQARLRAIEEGVPVIRSTPTGISAVIDANGGIVASLPYQQAGFIETRLPPAHPPTLFARYGNILPMAFALLLAVAGIALSRKRR